MQKKDPNSIKTTIPLPVLIGETRALYCWCQADKSELVSNGLNWDIIETLPSLCNKCEALAVDCKVEKIALSQYRTKLKNKFMAASKKRTQISKKIRYALFVTKSIHKIPTYHRRRAYPEIIEDLFNLSALCSHFKDVLGKTGFDQKQASYLKDLSLELQNVSFTLSELVLKNLVLRTEYRSAYRDLYLSAQTIRNSAFEVFPSDSPRRCGYRSQYREKHK
jgi:hypothetical protein